MLEFIANTYLLHSAEFPDPNEKVEPLRFYLAGQKLLQEDKVEEAINIFQQGLTLQNDSRHAQAGMGLAMTKLYESTQDVRVLQEATEYLIRATEIGMKYGRVLYTEIISSNLATLGDKSRLESFFANVLTLKDNQHIATTHLAQGFAKLNDPHALDFFEQGIKLAPQNLEVFTPYLEYLLTLGMWEQVAQNVPADHPYESLHLYRGYALEQLGKLEDAENSYNRYTTFSTAFPAPKQYRITESKIQGAIRFEGDPLPDGENAIDVTCLTNISKCIQCEAGGETDGHKRVIGWTIRNRVFNHSTGCLYFGRTGTALCDQYVSVINYGFCAGSTTTTASDNAASDIYYWNTPEPVSKWCATTTLTCNVCDSVNCRCPAGNTLGSNRNGYLYEYATSGSCPSNHPSGCGQSPSKKCGDGGSDNCMYIVP